MLMHFSADQLTAIARELSDAAYDGHVERVEIAPFTLSGDTQDGSALVTFLAAYGETSFYVTRAGAIVPAGLGESARTARR